MFKRLLVVAFAASGAVFAPFIPAHGHGGGTDSNGGHYCREAGYNSGKCAPLGSYHCHSAGCVEPGGNPSPAPAQTTRATSAPPPPPPTTLATTTTASTTTTSTTIRARTTDAPRTTELDANDARASTEDEASAGETIAGLALLGGLGYGAFRLVQRRRAKA